MARSRFYDKYKKNKKFKRKKGEWISWFIYLYIFLNYLSSEKGNIIHWNIHTPLKEFLIIKNLIETLNV